MRNVDALQRVIDAAPNTRYVCVHVPRGRAFPATVNAAAVSGMFGGRSYDAKVFTTCWSKALLEKLLARFNAQCPDTWRYYIA